MFSRYFFNNPIDDLFSTYWWCQRLHCDWFWFWSNLNHRIQSRKVHSRSCSLWDVWQIWLQAGFQRFQWPEANPKWPKKPMIEMDHVTRYALGIGPFILSFWDRPFWYLRLITFSWFKKINQNGTFVLYEWAILSFHRGFENTWYAQVPKWPIWEG